MRTVQKNIRLTKEDAEWMDKHPLSNNSLVTYGLHLVRQIEANIIKPVEYTAHISHIPTPEDLKEKLPF